MYKKATLYSSIERSRQPLWTWHRPGCPKISISSQAGTNVEASSSYLGALFLVECTFDLKKRDIICGLFNKLCFNNAALNSCFVSDFLCKLLYSPKKKKISTSTNRPATN